MEQRFLLFVLKTKIPCGLKFKFRGKQWFFCSHWFLGTRTMHHNRALCSTTTRTNIDISL